MKKSMLPSIALLAAALAVGSVGIATDALARGGGGGHGGSGGHSGGAGSHSSGAGSQSHSVSSAGTSQSTDSTDRGQGGGDDRNESYFGMPGDR